MMSSPETPAANPPAKNSSGNFKTVLGVVILAVTCISWDYLLESATIVSQPRRRAVLDNLTHGLIALLSWTVVIEALPPKRLGQLAEVVTCGLLGSALDLDHFLAALTFDLKEALALPYRPPLHSSTLIIIISLIFLIAYYFTASPGIKTFGLIFIVAAVSHQIRDGFRRGLWFWPCCSTPPIPYIVYVACVCALPLLVKQLRVPPLFKGGGSD